MNINRIIRNPEDIKNFVVDIDDHLIIYDKSMGYIPGGIEKYKTGKPNIEEIEILNDLYSKGNRIILWTGRNWDKYDFTKKQLNDFNIMHDELLMGKPQGVYVDKDSKTSLKECI